LKGKYVCAMDIVQFLDTPEMKEWLNVKKSISERTVHRWMEKNVLSLEERAKGSIQRWS